MAKTDKPASRPLQQFQAFLRESAPEWTDSSQRDAIGAKVEDLLGQVARIAGVDRDAAEEGLVTVQLRRGNSLTRWGPGGGLGHGPLDKIIPHTCHITIVLCNPLPIGPQVCVVIELPWPCG